MRYVSIDIETSGLNPNEDILLEFAAIIEDTDHPLILDDLPIFHRYIKWDRITGQLSALIMNHQILKETLEHLDDAIWIEDLPKRFYNWLLDNGFKRINNRVEVTAAGKNFASFDRLFLTKIPDWSKHIQFHRRCIDPAMLWWDGKSMVPGTEECCRLAGITMKDQHRAVDDAWTVIRLVRRKFEST